jgi:adenylate cyclase class 2
MFEIELKARVHDYDAVKKTLDGFALYKGFAKKNDVYFRNESAGVTARIRTEDFFAGAGEKPARAYFVTHKRKELRKTGAGAAIEVNDEKEFTVNDSEPLKALLEDAGFAVKLIKQKSAHKWQSGDAVIELCTVPPLGDFLEIEIVCGSNDDSSVAQAREKIESLIERAGVSLNDIEERYYSDLLKAEGL